MVRIWFILSIMVVSWVAQASTSSATLEKIKKSGVITIGHRESSIPFSYLDGDQKPVGYTMDLCLEVVEAVKKHLGMPTLAVKYLPISSQTRIPLVVNGTVDLECGSTTNSKARQKQVAFAVTHFIANIRVLTKKGLNINALDDLKGNVVVTTAGSTADRFLKTITAEKSLRLRMVYGKDHSESFLMVETGRAEAFVMDDILLAALVANSKNPAEFTIVGPVLTQEPYGIMMRRDDPAFRALVNNALVALFNSGSAESSYKKWFLNAIPPKNINLNLPMSKALQEAFKHPSDSGV